MTTTELRARWRRLARRRKVQAVLGVLLLLAGVVAAVSYLVDLDGLALVDGADPRSSYIAVFTLVALDAVMPIFPGETTLNAASTAAAQGTLELWPIMVMGSLGAIVGDSALFWLARRYSRRVQPQLDRARANVRVREALDVLDSSAPALIIGGRYVPGLRFVVNASMGLSGIRYRRFLGWSVISGVLWSVYTCAMAYRIGLALGEFPLASVIISGLVTTVVLAIVLLSVRRRRRLLAADQSPSRAGEGS